MKKLLILGLFFSYFSAFSYYTSTYLPTKVAPPRPDFPGYDEHTLGQQYYLAGSERKGAAFYEDAAQKGYLPAYRKLGDIYYYKKKKPEIAKEYYRTAADGGDILALESLAMIYELEENFKDAVVLYEKLAQKNPQYLLKVQELHEQLGNQKEAAEAQKKYAQFQEYYYWDR